ncbi:MAG: CapA family protein, partial [Planctomycetota bacterium]
MRTAALALSVSLALSSCGKERGSQEYEFTKTERQFDSEYTASEVELSGIVVDTTGAPVEDATVTLIAWGDASANHERSATTDGDGRYRFQDLTRRSVLARVSREGYYDEIVAIDLQSVFEVTVHDGGTVVMLAKRDGLVRFIIGGDAMFGRRYEDRDEDGITNEPEDLIHSNSRGEDAIAIMRYFQPSLSLGDYTQVNLETPVAEEAVEEHPYKEFKFFTHPDTLVALTYCGVDAVSFGNNHVYDLMEPGMVDTFRETDETGMAWFGAGYDETDARDRLLTDTVNGVPFAFQGFNGILPNNFPPWGPIPWPEDIMYNAKDTPVVKGGSLELNDDNVDDFLTRTVDDYFSIPVLHGGFEYGEYPSKNMRAKTVRSIEGGAGIVISHHPHTIYGVAMLEGHSKPTLALLSLGNLVFDQDVFETFQSVLAIVDVTTDGADGYEVERVRLVPFHIEGYIPKLTSGDWAARMGRHVGHISTHLPRAPNETSGDDGLVGATVFPAGHRVAVCTDRSQYSVSETQENIVVDTSNGLSDPIPYERTGPADMLGRLELNQEAGLSLGRDLMLYGGFEDFDVDDGYHEAHLWNQSDARYAQNQITRSGSGAFVLLRRSSDSDFASTWLRNRVTFIDGAPITIRGYLKGENAGTVEVVVRWFIRDERDIISTTLEYRKEAGTY